MIPSKGLALKRDHFGAVAIAVGLAVCWMTHTPLALLVRIGIAFLRARQTIVHVLNVSLAVAMTISVFAIEGHGTGLPTTWAPFLSLALLIGTTVCAAKYRRGRADKRTELAPQRSQTIDGSAELSGLVHREDHFTAEQAAARAFWTGVPQVMRCRLRQQDLQEREQNLSQLIDMVSGHLWLLASNGEPIFHNNRLTDYLGFALADLRTRGAVSLELIVERIMHPDDVENFTETLRRSLATGVSFSNRYRVRRSDGVYRWMEGRAEPFRDQNGRIVQWYGISHDIDDQISAEDALNRSERHLHSLIDALPIQVCSWVPSGEMTYINKRYSDALGFADVNFTDFLATTRALIHPDDAERVCTAAAHCLSTGNTFALRYRRRSKDGSFRWLDSRFEPLRNENGTIAEWYGLVVDVDDEVRVQEKLRAAQVELARASQAANLAELSASIAHEVAQPLAALVSSSDTCQRWLTSEPPNIARALRALERVILSANSAVDVVTGIRTLFKQALNARTVCDLGTVIGKTRDLVADEAAYDDIRWDVVIDEGLPALAFDNVQIQQVLVNLMRNAIEAMRDASGRRILTVRVHQVDGVVCVEIGDTGPGIEFPEQIFQPFFTTKAEGMGMGLAICRSIVESHGGRLWAEAGEPHGARFIFTLADTASIQS
ncbi:PAS domain-containing protein [Rhizobium sp. BK251]|uniref:PAS domain-containing sensor histidine kinase n=1 Tax=Rhizobium sp. BK251 TaxID=2512125 RepID=UPI001052C7E9|nr:PAS domain-containing protein [Rhizobium sp. BK251]TCL64687.1 PAS domain S-box-containing protein [Rhizobium sp. BK251]